MKRVAPYCGLGALTLAVAAMMSLPDAAAAAETVQGTIQRTEAISLGSVLQMATGLLLVLGLIFGAAWFVRRYGRFQGVSSDQLRLLGGIHLGQRERIIMVQADDVCLVVGVSPGCIRTLHVIPVAQMQKAVEYPGGPAGAESFFSRFNQEIRKRMQS